MFYLNTIEQLFLFVEQLDQLEVCLPYSRLLTGMPILAVFQNLRWNSNKTSLVTLNCFVFDRNQNLRNWFLIPLLNRFNILYFYRADKEITYTQKQTTRDFSLISIDLASRLSAEKREVSRKDSVKSLRRKIRGDESLSSSFLYGERNSRNIDCLVWLNI